MFSQERQQRNGAGAVSKRVKRDQSDRMYYAELAWFVQCSDAVLSYRSALGGQIAALERGCATSQPNTDPYLDSQVGWDRHRGSGLVDRERTVRRRWIRLSRTHQHVLAAYYLFERYGHTEADEGATQDERDRKTKFYEVEARRSGYSGLHEVHAKLVKANGAFRNLFPKVWPVVLASNDAEAGLRYGAQEDASSLGKANRKCAETIRDKAEKAVKAAHDAYYALIEADLRDEPLATTWEERWAAHKREMARRDVLEVFQEEAEVEYPTKCPDGVWRQ
jgi:hypothetical protein